MIETRGLSKRFNDKKRGEIRAVDNVSFACKPGQIYGLLGANGAGKTTTLRMLATILEPSDGTAVVCGHDVVEEPEKVRDRYGDGKPYQFQFDGAPTCNDHLLIARRLIEAGVRVVTLSFGRWDSHGKNFDLVRDHGGKLDQCLSALIDDLEVRGMLDDVTVSRRHAEFRREDGTFRVVDVGSLNGTYVNREPVDSAVLANGDEVQIGKFRLVFLTGPKQGDDDGGTGG